MTTFISVIVPVYNAAEYLNECVDSLLAQNMGELEIILVNDGSKDNSAEICKEYANKNSNIVFIDQPNQGQMKASMAGLAIAKGSYIGFVDSDDFVSPDTYKIMKEEVDINHPDIISMAGVRFCGDIEKPFCDKLESGFYDRVGIDTYIIPNLFSNHDLYGNRGIQPSKCLKLFKAELIRNVYQMIPTDIEIAEDLLTSYTAIVNADSISILDKELIGYHYRFNPKSVSWRYKNNLFNRSMKLCMSLRNIEKVKDNIVFQKEVDYEVCFFAINAFFNEYLMKNTNPFRIRKQSIKKIVSSSEVCKAVNNINIKEVKYPNKPLISLIKKKRVNSLHCIGVIISALRRPIVFFSGRII